MNEFVGILLCAVPCFVAFWCFFVMALKWPILSKPQKRLTVMLLLITICTSYYFIFQFPVFQISYRLDWFLTTTAAYVPVTYYSYVCHLTGTGSHTKRVRAFMVPTLICFITLLLYMAMGEKSADEYVRQVKFGENFDFKSIPVLWQIKFIFSSYVYRIVLYAQSLLILIVTHKRIGQFHKEVKEFYADGDERFFIGDKILRFSGIVLLFSLCLMCAFRYSMYKDDIYYVIIMDVLLTVSLIMVTVYSLSQKMDDYKLKAMAEETKNMGRAVKTRAALKERLLRSIDDEFYTDSSVTIMSLSEALETNRTYLGDLIHEMYGMSFADFVNDLRIKKAIKQMREIPLNTPLTKVALMCGYTTYQQFARNFEEFAHLTPSEWMKRYR